jgi:hypothetical protein
MADPRAILPKPLQVRSGLWLCVAGNGVACLVDDLAVTGAAGANGQGWWVRVLRGPRARIRYQRSFEPGQPQVEWHEAGTVRRLGDVPALIERAAREARRDGIA